MNLKTGVLALGGLLLVSAAAEQSQAQLLNAGFETQSVFGPTFPQSWDLINGARRRTVGDGQTPTLPAAHTGMAAVELTPQPVGNSDFIGVNSNALTDPLDIFSGRNNVSYTFDPPNGPGMEFSCWVMIPASDPVVKQRAGLKLEFRRTANDSVYEGFDYLFIDPSNPTFFPGLTEVVTPTGPGVHTNGQWLFYENTFSQSQFALNDMGEPNWPLPPENPNAKCTLLCIRFGLFDEVAMRAATYADGARGTVFFDDVDLRVAGGCAADFNGSGTVSVQDIFDFLAAYFSNAPSADVNNSGAVTVQDIFDFLALYFAGC
jgi:hypothetical protein